MAVARGSNSVVSVRSWSVRLGSVGNLIIIVITIPENGPDNVHAAGEEVGSTTVVKRQT
jgi:hypothetical protein